MSGNPKVFLIVPAFGHYDYVYETVRSAFECTPDISICIFDDATPATESIGLEVASWDFDKSRFGFVHFHENGGLTRSWNAGLQTARQAKFDYTICGNSDLLFTPGWFEPIEEALNSGWSLAGPLTNAAGTTLNCHQNIDRYIPSYEPSDDPDDLAEVVFRCQALGPPIESALNGFCLIAKTDVWWANAFDEEHVFDPQYKMTLNEDRLQGRWRARGLKIGCVPQSFVLHYRSVSRGDKFKHGKWLRKGK